MNKFKVCKYLEDSLYLAPDEIRACCQRFFYKGKMRGDAKLIKVAKGKTPTVEEIKAARVKIFNEIQKNENKDCEGCKYLTEVEEKPKITANVNHLSIEHHTFCNLRCNYCSPLFYGGKKPNYDVVKFTSDFAQQGMFSDCNQVVWGGGEPTLDKSFELVVKNINKNVSPKVYHRVFTNSVRFSKPLKNFLDQGLVKITTSIDAGSEEVFKIVRGRKKFNEVFENLKIYAEKKPEYVTIKYIFTDENSSKEEIDLFVQKIKEFNLIDCCFQISTNYKRETIDNYLKWIAYIFAKLSNEKIQKIFLDDLISVRMTELNNNQYLEILNFLKNEDLENAININDDDIIIYGSGQIGKDLVSKSNLFKNLKNYDVIDSDIKKIGNKFFDKVIKSPDCLRNDNRKILIASAQSYGEIFAKIKNLQNSSKSIIVPPFRRSDG